MTRRRPLPPWARPLPDFLWGWLMTTATWPTRPDTDGSAARGWHLWTGIRYVERGLLTLEPDWAVYSK